MSGSRRPFLAPTIVGVLALLAFAWARAAPSAALEALAAHRGALYLEPWRIFSSLFLHDPLPHLLFNLLTLWVLGARVTGTHGSGWFVTVFLAASLVGHTVHTLIGRGYVIGISGGVSGLYGFLLRRTSARGPRGVLREWPMSWIYPLALLGLFVADLAGALTIANVNHVAGIATGWLLARAFAEGSSRRWRLAATLPVTLSLLLVTYRPWDPVWRAVHGAFDASQVLPVIPCRTVPQPPDAGVASASPVLVTILNSDETLLSLAYLSSEGELVPSSITSARARSFLPLRGSIWRVADGEGRCIQWLEASRDGVVQID